ncbi:2,3-bisphosphoglycerate-independent phosphoglycerate mutase [Heliorestis acidaminivorans]|uniref:2,3-bisphosphoglycerate-independent phosphoglycerate mutase n=1 Tax=Heliorestis acidaminivorans TaxID=553427 RepID=A0A6I0F169_9FIRM|nr:2,3-bisphosphoglycerate-independent phosphoglycerate mutase [Heliorestis acidaminivorans]KAB2952094.1 2,3-bisphosphoglycerate-independent phosphoglycerate mutase [Heliorestis acidaminivorans]
MTARQKPVMLLVLDGWGLRDEEEGNTLKIASIETFKQLWEAYPHTAIEASGENVGLPAGQIGNSEVGHLNIGAGRVVYQELTRILKSIATGEIQQNAVLLQAIDRVKNNKNDRERSLHFIGLLSDGGVHSHIDHLFAMLDLAVHRGIKNIVVHAFLDGRDVPPANAAQYIKALEHKLQELGCGVIGSISGRYYAMDRDNRWERTEKAWKALVHGQGEQAFSALEALQKAYDAGNTDEFVLPTALMNQQGEPQGNIGRDDSVIFFNFRADRARQLTRVFIEESFADFDRAVEEFKPHFVCLTQYDINFDAPVAYMPQNLHNTFGEVISSAGLKQLRIAETEKYAHVTFFFNGGVEEPNEEEDRLLIASPKVPTYDLEPAMSAGQVTEEVVSKIKAGTYDVIVMNLANPDMVGHTGVLKAAIEAVEEVDKSLKKIVSAILEQEGILIITSDHGNVEMMIDPNDGGPHTAHTTNPVPVILVSRQYKDSKLRASGALEDIAPTMLDLLGLPIPPEMTGRSLLSLELEECEI